MRNLTVYSDKYSELWLMGETVFIDSDLVSRLAANTRRVGSFKTRT